MPSWRETSARLTRGEIPQGPAAINTHTYLHRSLHDHSQHKKYYFVWNSVNYAEKIGVKYFTQFAEASDVVKKDST